MTTSTFPQIKQSRTETKAQVYINQNVDLGLRDRELAKLKEVEYALQKIELGTYGICEETDGPIEKKRLEKMPWTRLCIDAAEEKERESMGRSQAS